MHFVACKASDIRTKENTDLRRLLTKIVESGEPYVEIKDYKHKTANGCYTALKNRIKEDRLVHLQVHVRGKRVFVINTLLIKEV